MSSNSDLSRAKHIVHIFQESFILDLIICEDKCDSTSFCPSGSVEELEIFQEVSYVV